MDLVPLYKYNNNGKIQIFIVGSKVNDLDYNKATVERQWGELGGTITPKSTPVKGKNIGKSNATSAYGQASKDAQSLWKKKKGEGYKSLMDLGWNSHESGVLEPQDLKMFLEVNLNKSQLDGDGRVKPMLLNEVLTVNFPKDEALRAKAKRKELKFPCIVDYKRDGVCTIASPSDPKGSVGGCVLSTRSGKDRHTPKGQKWDDIVPHLVEQLHNVWNALAEAGIETYDFHGETYKHGLTLQEIQKANKKVNHHSSSMELFIFDIVDEDLNMEDRRSYMQEMQQIVLANTTAHNIHFIIGELVHNEEELFAIEKRALAALYEGLVGRHLDGMYKIGGRSNDVLKMVRMDKSTVRVINIVPMDKAPDMGKFLCIYGNRTVPFHVTPGKGYDHKSRRELLSNKDEWYGKGRTITIYHRGLTDDGLPRIATAPKPT